MTRNQLTYQANLETKRSNLAKEKETNRSNVAREEETHRYNKADISLRDSQYRTSLLLGQLNRAEDRLLGSSSDKKNASKAITKFI